MPVASINGCDSDVLIASLLAQLGFWEALYFAVCISAALASGPGVVALLLACLAPLLGAGWFADPCNYTNCNGGAFIAYITVTGSPQAIGDACPAGG